MKVFYQANLFCRSVKASVKQCYDIIVYSDKRFGDDHSEQKLILDLSGKYKVLLIEGQRCAEKEDAKTKPLPIVRGNLHILRFDLLDKEKIWTTLHEYISNRIVPAFIFFSPLYSLLKTTPCEKVIYVNKHPGEEAPGEKYLLNEAHLVMNNYESSFTRVASLLNV